MIKRILLFLFLIGLITGAYIAYKGYEEIYGNALSLDKEQVSFYIRTGWGQAEVLNALEKKANLKSPEFARVLMDKKNYQGSLIVAGKYTLSRDMSLNDLINHLRAGNGEEEVSLALNYVRKLGELPAIVAKSIEADSAEVAHYLLSKETARKFGFNSATFISMFIPDTYKMEWDTDAEEFTARMAHEYKKFWTDKRKQKAQSIGLSQSKVSTLASIVQAEQQVHKEERKTIAGLYLNRLDRGMKLQSDPTVVYSVGDFSINRVLTRHLSTQSPYNTYLNKGLPPGPINLPSKDAIDAVLNAESNNYFYMCAKADFSGYHAFATNLIQHNKNARAFQNALNGRKIYR